MNAIKFIQQYGVEKAREVVEGAPRICSYWQEYGVDNNQYYGYDDFYGDWYKYWDITNAPMWQKIFTKEEFSFNRVKVKDLKRLVESVYFVKEHYTLDRAKIYAASPYTAPEIKERLEQAIADYEAIYGGEHV